MVLTGKLMWESHSGKLFLEARKYWNACMEEGNRRSAAAAKRWERKLKPATLDKVRKAIRDQVVVTTKRYYVEAPYHDTHSNHSLGEYSSVENPLHPELIAAKIRDNVKSGIALFVNFV
ncbi:hypothetical protein QZH41_018796 [Actinostola sp. cb2023]|nr:hypothetical protein QZH41_018796 [Actinostola sp. cb2023]